MKKHLLPVLFLLIITSLCRAQNPILWGTAYAGGANKAGAIFSYNSATGSVTDAHNFGSGADGQLPDGSLIKANNGLLYGMTYQGGTKGAGTIFSYDIFTDSEIVVHNFVGSTDGDYPGGGSLIKASSGILYGMATYGGTDTVGVIFSYNTSTGSYAILHSFGKDTDGDYPEGSLVEASNGLLYGMTFSGGAHEAGTIFSYNISLDTETVLYSFNGGVDGYYPYGSLIQANDSMLYGMTAEGGSGGAYGGIIFSYNISTGNETLLHNFGSGTDGKNPYGSLLYANNGLIYGMTYGGGTRDSGIIFSYNIFTATEDDIHDFGTGADGQAPEGSLIQARDGVLYGMTYQGGANNDGTVFSYNISTATEKDIYDFNGTDGAYPPSDLIEVDTAATGINQLKDESGQLTVYPNPSTGLINISSAKAIDYVTVTNLLGQTVLKSAFGVKQTHFTFELKDEGMYFVSVTSGNKITTDKIVVTK